MSTAIVTSKVGTPLARFLNIILLILTGIFALTALAVLAVGIAMLLPGTFSGQVFDEFVASGVDALTPRGMAMSCFLAVLLLCAYLAVMTLLRRIVGTLLAGDPFVPENISRLRRIWLVIAAAEIIRLVAKLLLSLSSDEVILDLRAGTWFLVFVIAALAEVFRHGAELRRDAELTV